MTFLSSYCVSRIYFSSSLNGINWYHHIKFCWIQVSQFNTIYMNMRRMRQSTSYHKCPWGKRTHDHETGEKALDLAISEALQTVIRKFGKYWLANVLPIANILKFDAHQTIPHQYITQYILRYICTVISAVYVLHICCISTVYPLYMCCISSVYVLYILCICAVYLPYICRISSVYPLYICSMCTVRHSLH